MELSAIARSSAKVLSVIKELPMWLLFAIDLFLMIILIIPELNRNVPVSIRPWVPLVALFFTILLIFRGLSNLFEYRKTQLLNRTNREKQRLVRVYEPIYAYVEFIRSLTTNIGRLLLGDRRKRIGGWSQGDPREAPAIRENSLTTVISYFCTH